MQPVEVGAAGRGAAAALRRHLAAEAGARDRLLPAVLGIDAEAVLADVGGLVPAEAVAGADVEPVPEAGLDRVHVDHVVHADADGPGLGLDLHHVGALGFLQRAVKTLAVGQLDRLPGRTDDGLDVGPLDRNGAHRIRAEAELAAIQPLDLASDLVAVFQHDDVRLVGAHGGTVQQEQQAHRGKGQGSDHGVTRHDGQNRTVRGNDSILSRHGPSGETPIPA